MTLARSVSARRVPLIAHDFAFRGISAANKLSKYHDHGPGRGTTGTIRTERTCAGPARWERLRLGPKLSAPQKRSDNSKKRRAQSAERGVDRPAGTRCYSAAVAAYSAE